MQQRSSLENCVPRPTNRWRGAVSPPDCRAAERICGRAVPVRHM